MTNTFKRRIYRFSLVSTTTFLTAILLYALAARGIAPVQLYLLCFIGLSAGTILSFKTLEIWSFWHEDDSVDLEDKEYKRNAYPITFYSEAAILILIALFLLASIIQRARLGTQDGLIFTFSLFVIGACILIGRLSSSLE